MAIQPASRADPVADGASACERSPSTARDAVSPLASDRPLPPRCFAGRALTGSVETFVAGERGMRQRMLEVQREEVARLLADVDVTEARGRVVPSLTTPLGLASTPRSWRRCSSTLAQRAFRAQLPRPPDRRHTGSAVGGSRVELARSERRGSALDAPSGGPTPTWSARSLVSRVSALRDPTSGHPLFEAGDPLTPEPGVSWHSGFGTSTSCDVPSGSSGNSRPGRGRAARRRRGGPPGPYRCLR